MSSITGINTYKKLDGGISSFTDGQITIEDGMITGVSYLGVEDAVINSSLTSPEITSLTTGNAVAHNKIDNLALGNVSLNLEVDTLGTKVQWLSANTLGTYVSGNLSISNYLLGNTAIFSSNVETGYFVIKQNTALLMYDFKNYTGTNNFATYTGIRVLNLANHQYDAYLYSSYGYYATLDGTGNIIVNNEMAGLRLPSIEITSNGFSICMWFRIVSVAFTQPIIISLGETPVGTAILAYLVSGILTIKIQNTGTVLLQTAVNAVNYIDSTFHHFVWTISPSGYNYVYIDNVLAYSNTTTVAYPQANLLRTYNFLATSTPSTFTSAYFRDLRIYNKFLSVIEITEIYNLINLKVGINNTQPQEALDITGNCSITDTYKIDGLDILSRGNLYVGNLKVIADKKGYTNLSNCFTGGSETQNANYAYFAFSSNTQNGYTCYGSTNNTTAYKAFGTGTNFWSSALNVYTPAGAYNSTQGAVISYNSTAVLGEWIQILMPTNIMLTNVNITFNSIVSPNGAPKLLYICNYNGSTWNTMTTWTNPTNTFGAKSIPIQPDFYTNRFLILFNSIYANGSSTLGYVAIQNVYFTGYTKTGTELNYFPSKMEIGRPFTLNTSIPPYTLQVNGDANIDGGLFLTSSVRAVMPVFKAYQSGTFTITANASLIQTATIVYDRRPYDGGAGGWQGTLYFFPIAGYYRVSVMVRSQDNSSGGNGYTAGIHLKYYNGTTGTNTLPNNDNFWIPTDGSTAGRRCGTIEEIVYANGNGDAVFPSCYSNTVFYWTQITINYIGV